jgi:hypothetical protein
MVRHPLTVQQTQQLGYQSKTAQTHEYIQSDMWYGVRVKAARRKQTVLNVPD